MDRDKDIAIDIENLDNAERLRDARDTDREMDRYEER